MLQPPPSLVVLSYSYVARQKQATVRRGTAAEVLAPLNTPPAPSSFPLLIVSGLHVIPRDGFKPSELEITIRRRKRSIFLRTLDGCYSSFDRGWLLPSHKSISAR